MNIVLPSGASVPASESAAALWREAIPCVAKLGKGDVLTLDASAVKVCDGALAAFVVELYRRALEQGFGVTAVDPNGAVAAVRGSFPAAQFRDDLAALGQVRKSGTAVQLGEAVVHIGEDALGQMAFLGEVTASLASLLFRPGRLRLRDTMLCFERAGIDALPITLLIGFLLGLILAFMSAASLRQFGVEVYVANLIAIGLFRELGPIITAIILAGRSGSAFAAEIGTMKVNEEIDALTTFGLPPVVFLALPRVIAATLVMPILTIFSIFAGLIGGAVVLSSMGVPPVTYWQHVINSATMGNVLFGLVKSAVFGLLVGLVGCSHGLGTGRTADAVGRAATAAVVGSLILITLFDGIFAVLSYLIGI
jgi:phospholipid/cholesterol/gamma-HCH transport system permease protein